MININVGDLPRHTYLGSSDAAAILGVGASYGGVQQTPLTVYMRKVEQAGAELPAETRRFLDRRKRFEPLIVDMLREEFDGKIVGVNKRYRDKDNDFLAAEVDFEWMDNDGVIQNGEIKTVSPFAFGDRHGWGEPGSADVPVHYAAQCTFAQMVTGASVTVLAALVGFDTMLFYRLERDQEVIDSMRAECVRFWHEHIIKRVPPEPQTMRDLSLLLTRARGRPVDVPDDIATMLASLKQARQSIAATKDGADVLEFEIGTHILKQWGIAPESAGEVEDCRIMHNGSQIASWNKQARSAIDGKALRADLPDVAAKYTKNTEFRVMRFNKPKGK